ncbi:glutamine synthetase family protein [Streptacidiphilus sp. P02-A3a]|uniref:glutamine synthetase family protein n=1 Tax=Streptacidiphilus sp. P02-A3a TaxID=2704468 RepID=UPI0015FDBA24|nr:glutamine synthetase family protein [Streptacidiphilus sp. P02-A3a]QMU71958.1 glutamine synthetase [Streptacidiphilus sp. P02-A3a]
MVQPTVPPAAGGPSRTPPEHPRVTAARLGAEGAVGLALGWVDNAGIARVKGVPLSRLAEAAEQGVGMSPVFDAFLVDDSITAGRWIGGPDGDLRLFPDLGRAVTLAAQPGWAWAPADRYQQDGAPHPACQRRFAARMAALAARRGLAVRAAYEVEWIVQREDGGYPTEGPAYGMHRLTDLSDYLRDLLTALEAQELTVQQIHPEYAPGQFEVSVAAEDPVGAADSTVLVRHTVRAVSAAHGLRASFAPAFAPGGVGNGAHLHLSLWRSPPDAEPVSLMTGGGGPYGLTAEGEAFLAGVLDQLPALLALGAPSPASYLRLVPSHWAGAHQCWGPENREAALRLIPGLPGRPETANAEVKCFDGAANPYLAVGGVIAAGLAGIDAGAELPPEVRGDPAADTGIPRLPTGLPQALAAFERSAVLREALGEVLHDTVAAVRRAEAAAFDGLEPAAVIDATRWRY